MSKTVPFGAVIVVGLLLEVTFGTTYYVATNGSDANAGTEQSPWRTVQKAANTLNAGDTALIRAGTYYERVTLNRSGQTGLPLAFQNYPGEAVVIDANGKGGSGIFAISNCSHISVAGLKLINGSGSSTSGIEVSSVDDLAIENCHTYITKNSGIKVNYSSNVLINNNEIERACDTGGEEDISIKLDSNHVTVSYNHIHDSNHEGIDVKEGAHDVLVLGNHIHNVERQGLYTDSWNRHTYNIEFNSNVVHDCQFGMGACAEMGGLLENVWFVNNIVYNCEGPGMFVADWGGATPHPIQNAYYINNTIHNTGWDWGQGMFFDTNEANNVVVRNNIFSQMTVTPILVQKEPISKTIDNNLSNTLNGTQPGWCILGVPSYANLAAGDFRLRKGSPGIDIGSGLLAPPDDLDGDPRPMAAAFDMGAFEWPLGDIEGNGHVNYDDFDLLADQWLTEGGTPSADISPLGGDSIVNWLDFSELAICWKK
jgi:hypothetical protein